MSAADNLLEGSHTVKECICCGKMKPVEEFYAHPEMGDGHLNKCKDCVREYASTRRAERPERIMLTRIATCGKRPTKKNAYRAVEAALMCGAIVKPNRCGVCGRVVGDGFKRIEAHHPDYTNPLAVQWLCTPCHKVAHGYNRRVPLEIIRNGGR